MEMSQSLLLGDLCPYALPADVRDCVTNWFGDRGERWLDELPAVAAGLVRLWEVEPTGPCFEGGTQALVLPVLRHNGVEAVLKIAHPAPDNVLESRALGIYGGRGAVRAYRRDPRLNAMLLERVRPGLPLARAMAREPMLRAQGAVLRRAARPLRGSHPFPAASALAASWLSVIRNGAGAAAGTVAHDAGARIEAFLADMALSAPCGLLVNSDGHCGNILSSTREGWLLVDPKPVAGCAEFETGCMFSPFAFGSPDHVADAGPDDDLGDLFRVACEARGGDPVIAGDWAAAKGLHDYLWAISVKSPQVARMAALLPPYMEATLAVSL